MCYIQLSTFVSHTITTGMRFHTLTHCFNDDGHPKPKHSQYT